MENSDGKKKALIRPPGGPPASSHTVTPSLSMSPHGNVELACEGQVQPRPPDYF